jgi:RNA polymerase sigma-70 factor (ECF subfamily)
MRRRNRVNNGTFMEDAPSALKLNLSDEQLAGRALAGCLDSFEELVRRYQVPLMRLLLRRGACQQDAEDLVQETFLRAFQSLKQYSSAWPFKTWIFTLGYRLAISHHRRKGIVHRQHDGSEVADLREGTLAQMERAETKRQLWDVAKRALSDEQFTAIWLYYVESLPATEVGRVMNRSWVWVKTNLHRSRRKLRASLAPKASTTLAISRERA